MNIRIYFNEEETAFIKNQGEGWVRKLVQKEMGGKVPVEKVEKIKKVVGLVEKLPNTQVGLKGDGLTTCKKCGSLLPFYKGKCKQGCK